MIIYKRLLVIAAILFSLKGITQEIAGGDFNINQIDDSTFLFQVQLYKYCSAASYPARIDSSFTSSLARIYENSTDNFVKSFSSSSIDSIVTIPLGDECFTPPGLCLESVFYSTTVILPQNLNGYYATWKVCCRNYEVNLQGSNDHLFYAQIPNPLLSGGNSTPQFNSLDEKGYMCIGYEKEIDFSCSDLDGDSLVYSLITPSNGFSLSGSKPFANSNYTTGFSNIKILGPGSICNIDSATGFVTVRSAQLGVFSISVKCEEYRNGLKIGEVTRTYVNSSLSCNNFRQSNFVSIPTSYDFKIGERNCFDVVGYDNSLSYLYLNFSSNDFDLGDKLYLPDSNNNGNYDFEWDDKYSGIRDSAKNIPVTQVSSTQFYSDNYQVGATFCWELSDCELKSNTKYLLDVQLVSNYCLLSDTTKIEIEINTSGRELSVNKPNSFSPNGDGIEDVFKMKKEDDCLQISHTRIYNLNGQLVFQSEDPNFFWNGKDLLDKDVSGGIYFVVYEGFYGATPTTESFKLLLYR
ncbi:MAG: gliding motility-associated C-terminal domain-containing protein [Flavobacteriales bacterium]